MRKWIPYNKNQIMWELMKEGPDYSFEVKPGEENPWDLRMRLVHKELTLGSGIASNWDEYLLQAIFQKGKAYIIHKDGGFQLAYDPSNLLRIVPPFEIIGRYLPPKSKSKKKGIKVDQKSSGVFYYKFGNVVTADIAGLALYLFEDVNSYTIGQAYAWNNMNEYTPVEVDGGSVPFDLKDFEAAGRHYNIKGKAQGAVFYHNHLGLINGLKELKVAFPEATSRDIRSLYNQFGIEPSSQIGRFFPRGGPTSKTRPPRKGKTPSVDDSWDEIGEEAFEIGDYIKRHHIQKEGGKVKIHSVIINDDLVVKNPLDLIQTIRENGDSIEEDWGSKIWEKVTGKAWAPDDLRVTRKRRGKSFSPEEKIYITVSDSRDDSVNDSGDSEKDPGEEEKIDHYINDYNIRKDPFNPDTLLMYHYLKDSDITLRSASDLVHNVRVSGEGISNRMANKVWTHVMDEED